MQTLIHTGYDISTSLQLADSLHKCVSRDMINACRMLAGVHIIIGKPKLVLRHATKLLHNHKPMLIHIILNMQPDLLHRRAELVCQSLLPPLQAAPQTRMSCFMLLLMQHSFLLLPDAPLLQSSRDISGHYGGYWSGPFHRKASCLTGLAIAKIHLTRHTWGLHYDTNAMIHNGMMGMYSYIAYIVQRYKMHNVHVMYACE